MAVRKSTDYYYDNWVIEWLSESRNIENFSYEWWRTATKIFRHHNANSGGKNHEPSENNGQKDSESTFNSAVITDDDHALSLYVTNDWWYSILIRVIKRGFIISQKEDMTNTHHAMIVGYQLTNKHLYIIRFTAYCNFIYSQSIMPLDLFALQMIILWYSENVEIVHCTLHTAPFLFSNNEQNLVALW